MFSMEFPGPIARPPEGEDDIRYQANSVDAVRRVGTLSRRGCREEFEARFTAEVMAANYERIYYKLIAGRRRGARPQGGVEERSTAKTVTSRKLEAHELPLRAPSGRAMR
jgi:hypothetical protein